MEPVPFHLERSSQVLTGQAGMARVGRALERFARVSQPIDLHYPGRAAALSNSTLVKAYLGLLC